MVIKGRSRTVLLSFLSWDLGCWGVQHHLNSLVVDRYGDYKGRLFACLRIHIVIVVGVIIAWASLPETLRSAPLLVGCLYCTQLFGVVVSSPPWSTG